MKVVIVASGLPIGLDSARQCRRVKDLIERFEPVSCFEGVASARGAWLGDVPDELLELLDRAGMRWWIEGP